MKDEVLKRAKEVINKHGHDYGVGGNPNAFAVSDKCCDGGHDYIEERVIECCRIQVLRCRACGSFSIGWVEGN